jgi:adenosylhomocysteine nucleosidase
MPSEVHRLVDRLEMVAEDRVGAWSFWRGSLDGYPIVVSKTLIGVANAAAATAIAVERYHPAAIVNQGTAGGHDPDLNLGDIVLGEWTLNLGAFKTGHRAVQQGSDPLEWTPIDLRVSEGSGGEDAEAQGYPRKFRADERLLATARDFGRSYSDQRVVGGAICSSDMWNCELDRIGHFRDRYNTLVEEMETASAAQIAEAFGIPYLAIRVVSNNITNGVPYDERTGEACQDFAYGVIQSYIAGQRGPRRLDGRSA